MVYGKTEPLIMNAMKKVHASYIMSLAKRYANSDRVQLMHRCRPIGRKILRMTIENVLENREE